MNFFIRGRYQNWPVSAGVLASSLAFLLDLIWVALALTTDICRFLSAYLFVAFLVRGSIFWTDIKLAIWVGKRNAIAELVSKKGMMVVMVAMVNPKLCWTRLWWCGLELGTETYWNLDCRNCNYTVNGSTDNGILVLDIVHYHGYVDSKGTKGVVNILEGMLFLFRPNIEEILKHCLRVDSWLPLELPSWKKLTSFDHSSMFLSNKWKIPWSKCWSGRRRRSPCC